jgi:hypothetical protein
MTTHDHTTVEAPDSNKERVKAFLCEQATDSDGDLYIKSREIAAATDLSAKQVGTFIAQLEREAADIRIERWAYSNATTWRVEPA